MVGLFAGGGGGEKVALVAGATGLVGKELVKSLLRTPSEWTLVYGIARRLPEDDAKEEARCGRYRFVQCDLLDRDETAEKLGALAGRVTHLFWATWASQFPLDTPECCAQNRAMLVHTLDALCAAGFPALRHVCLQTGTKHYVSLKAPGLAGPYLEGEITQEHDRNRDKFNFYFDIERLIMDRASRGLVNSWSVHRPGLLFGESNRSFYNVMGSLCVYASLCRHLGMPFRFYGTKFCWEEHYIDMSDARIVASQQIWWASSSHDHYGSSEAFNAVEPAPFIWKHVWPALASKFGIKPEPRPERTDSWLSDETSYAEIMRDKERAWDDIVSVNALRKTRIGELANWGFLDMLFRFPGKLLAAPGKAERLGFAPALQTYTDAAITEAVLHWIDRIREMRFIP